MLNDKLSIRHNFSPIEHSYLVDPASLAGISLSFGCKKGQFSTSKCKVLYGETMALQTETGLTDAEKGEGCILSCVRSAFTDSLHEVEDLGKIVLPPSKSFPCRISTSDGLATDVVCVLLCMSPPDDFGSIPSQCIEAIDPGGVSRTYSLAHANAPDKIWEI